MSDVPSQPDPHHPQDPALSVVVVTPGDFAQIRRSVRHLAAQRVAARLELILVAPSRGAVADHDTSELAAFGRTEVVEAGPIPNVDKAAALGIMAASAASVAVIEDHAYVQEGWAEAIIAAHASGTWVSVGSVMQNANPRTSLSWANLLLGYGWWIDPSRAGEMHDVPSHNGSYRRESLAAFGPDLIDRMGRDGGLHDQLRADGGRMFLAAGARVAHANPSRIPPTAELRFNAGRLYGTGRAQNEDWNLVKRAVYALAAPAIVAVRLRRLHAEHLTGEQHHAALWPRILGGLVLALIFDAVGQAAGYLRGFGRSREVLATFEMDRIQHLDRRDRRWLSEPRPATPPQPTRKASR